MKNVLVLTQPDEIHSYARKLWRTGSFRTSHDNGGLVHGVIDKLASLPRYFYERSDNRLETGHFTSWWGGIQLRPDDYKQDGVHDLYYLHEMYHAATMPAIPGLTYGTFLQKIGNNEGNASVCSEITAYFAMPDLRKQSFNFEIYVDRFLNNPVYQALWNNNPDEFIQTMKYTRRNVMHPQYEPQDLPEKWIHQFADQNKKAAAVWRESYNDIEKATWQLRVDALDSDTGPVKAMDNFMNWLTTDEITQGSDIPFPNEALDFADIYWDKKEEYSKEVAGTQKQKTTGTTTKNNNACKFDK